MRRGSSSILSLSVVVLGFATLRAGAQPVGSEFRVNAATASMQWRPAIASDASGGSVVAWESNAQDGSGRGVFVRRFASSWAPFGTELRVNSFTTGYQTGPAVATGVAGGFVVVWGSYGQVSGYDVFGQRFTISGTPEGSEFRVNSLTSLSQYAARIATDASGGFVVVWHGDVTSGRDVFGRRFSSGGVPLGGEFRVNTTTPGFHYWPDVAAHPSGGFAVVWEIQGLDGDDLGVFGQRFTSTGAPAGGQFRVNTYTSGDEYRPRIAHDASGAFTVVWACYRVGRDDIFGQRFSASGAPAGTEFRVNEYTTGFQTRAAIASDRAGGFVVAWQSYLQDGSHWGVFGRRFDRSGAPVGPEFRVNTTTTSFQHSVALASDPNGNLTVVWAGDTAGSSLDVYGQRFLPALAKGDVDGNGTVNVSDVLYLINHLFAGGPPPMGPANVNGDGVVNVSDVLYLINHLFAGGPAPV